MVSTLRFIMAVLGASAVAICLAIFIPGPAQTAHFFEALFDTLTSGKHAAAGPWPPVMDSEIRFYAPFWGGYGVALVAFARDLALYSRLIVPATALFFLGGIGRAISWITIGAPHPFFLLLMVIEVSLPVVMIALWSRVRRGIYLLSPRPCR